MDQRLTLTFLGTSAGVPGRNRNVSALAVHSPLTGRGWFLWDCGDGTQQQMQRAHLSLHDLDGIGISHVHGDHLYGLPGLLATMGLSGRSRPLRLLAPLPVWAWLQTTRRLTDLHLPFDIDFVDIDTLQQQPLCLAARGEARLSVSSHPLHHGVPCHALRMQLDVRQRHLDVEALQAAGLPPGPAWGRLRNGEDVQLEGRTLLSRNYLVVKEDRLVLVLAGDNATPALLHDACAGAQVLVHEATYTHEVRLKLGPTRLHSSAREVAEFARDAGVPNLLLTHVSPRHQTPEGLALLYQEAQAHYGGTVFVAQDFDRFRLEAGGRLTAL